MNAKERADVLMEARAWLSQGGQDYDQGLRLYAILVEVPSAVLKGRTVAGIVVMRNQLLRAVTNAGLLGRSAEAPFQTLLKTPSGSAPLRGGGAFGRAPKKTRPNDPWHGFSLDDPCLQEAPAEVREAVEAIKRLTPEIGTWHLKLHLYSDEPGYTDGQRRAVVELLRVKIKERRQAWETLESYFATAQ